MVEIDFNLSDFAKPCNKKRERKFQEVTLIWNNSSYENKLSFFNQVVTMKGRGNIEKNLPEIKKAIEEMKKDNLHNFTSEFLYSLSNEVPKKEIKSRLEYLLKLTGNDTESIKTYFKNVSKQQVRLWKSKEEIQARQRELTHKAKEYYRNFSISSEKLSDLISFICEGIQVEIPSPCIEMKCSKCGIVKKYNLDNEDKYQAIVEEKVNDDFDNNFVCKKCQWKEEDLISLFKKIKYILYSQEVSFKATNFVNKFYYQNSLSIEEIISKIKGILLGLEINAKIGVDNETIILTHIAKKSSIPTPLELRNKRDLEEERLNNIFNLIE